jgi:hypothetical protein
LYHLKITIAHIVCPVNAPAGSELHRVQPVTFESMRRAKANAADVADVTLLTAQLPDDRAAVPHDFLRTPDLTHALNEILPSSKRRLPLLAEVIQSLHSHTTADYLIYTNADIAVMPGFYRMVAQYAAQGYDAFAINRRRITARFSGVEQLDQMYAEAGESHSGFDTFVFHRTLAPRFILQQVCIGLPFVDRAMIHNLYAHAEKFRLFTGKHLTFHIGMELVKNWGNATEVKFNETESLTVLKKLKPFFRIGAFPGANRNFFVRHFKWLMNPTFHYPTMLKLDLSQWNSPRPARVQQPKQETKQGFYEWLVRQINFDDDY